MELKYFEMFMGLNGNALKSIQRFKNHKMRKFNLSSAHTNCLCRLLLAGEEGLTQTELVRQEMMDPSQISRVLRELTAQGYARQDGEEGRYRRRYFLTESGLEVAKEIRAVIEEIYRYVCMDIADEDLCVFLTTFDKICKKLNKAEQVYLKQDA